MIKYRAWLNDIKSFEVTKETAKQVVYLDDGGEHRSNKSSDWGSWHDTWESAHQWLLDKAEEELKELKVRFDRIKEKIDHLKEMKPDKAA